MNREIKADKSYILGIFFITISFLILWVKSLDLTLIKGWFYQDKAEINRLRKVQIVSPRGRIITKNGTILAENTPVYQDEEGNIVPRQQGLIEKSQGKKITTLLKRKYALSESAAHLTGYLSAVEERELNTVRCEEKGLIYQINDLIGRGGLEQEYDCLLAGVPGEQLVEVDSRGKTYRILGYREPQYGQDLVVSINASLQKFIYEQVKDKKASVVVLNPHNGQIISMVSAPSFDPNVFGYERDEEKITKYLQDDENMPFLNRSISGSFHPGSVFKPIVAVAALQEKIITSSTTIEDTGVIKVGNWEYANWYWTDYGRTEGEVDVIKALKRSNDIYFYRVGEQLGAEKIAQWAQNFGLGKRTGVDLPSEAEGLVPSPEWKRKYKGEAWFLGNTYHYAIGQGDLTTTPLQIAQITSFFANGGSICQPKIRLEYENDLSNCRKLNIKPEYIKVVNQGLLQACQSGGTAFPFFDFEPKVACKTGTAEVGDGTNDSHAWFTMFIPFDEPKWVITVFIERGGSGAYEAAPIAKKIASYLKKISLL